MAAAAAASTLRQEGFDGPVVVVGDEDLPPYERPPLSKEFLRGEQSLEEGFVHPADWYGDHGIELRRGATVERLDLQSHRAELVGGERIAFDRVLLATGATPRRPPIPGLDLPGVMDLRRPADAERIREAARGGARVVIVGMGFIGAEVAASLRSLGSEVTVVEHGETPLARAVGPQIGRVLEAVHRDHGVAMHFRQDVERFEGGEDVEAVLTASGLRLESDLVVVGIGVRPNVEVAEASGVPVGNGVPVDSRLRTEVPGVFAAGDVALHDHPLFGPVRVEHFDNALKMGAAAARSMLGAEEPFDDPHWFWSDQYDTNVQMAGIPGGNDELVMRGNLEDRSFTAFYLQGGVLRAALSFNRPRDVRRSMGLIRASVRPDPAALADQDVDLRTLAPPKE
jgi:3-phenylpropionate/trans-cinnamate dioxygenase ferredoxin reductase component